MNKDKQKFWDALSTPSKRTNCSYLHRVEGCMKSVGNVCSVYCLDEEIAEDHWKWDGKTGDVSRFDDILTLNPKPWVITNFKLVD